MKRSCLCVHSEQVSSSKTFKQKWIKFASISYSVWRRSEPWRQGCTTTTTITTSAITGAATITTSAITAAATTITTTTIITSAITGAANTITTTAAATTITTTTTTTITSGAAATQIGLHPLSDENAIKKSHNFEKGVKL